jgi:hypothetical protein
MKEGKKTTMKLTRTLCLSAALAVLVGPILAQEIPNEGPVPTTALISVDSKNPVELDPKKLSLQLNGHDAPINSLTHANSGPMEIGILIDDGLRGTFGQQLSDLSKFINALPPNAKVLVGYMQNGLVRSSGHFTADHQEIANQLRVTTSIPGSSASPYFCLSDFVKKWPSQDRAARFVLMITNGVDPYNGRPSITNENSPYVDAAALDAQRAGVAVYSIYFPDSGFRRGFGSLSGQGYLQKVGDATGGTLFNIGTIPPVSIMPFLDQFGRAINASYELGFMANAGNGKRDTMTRVKVKSSQQGVKIRAPEAVRPGLVEAPVGR